MLIFHNKSPKLVHVSTKIIDNITINDKTWESSDIT